MIHIRPGLRYAVVFLVLTGAVAARAGEESLPWKKGDIPVEGWVVKDVLWHEEYSRYSLMQSETFTCVEVRYRDKDDPAEWCSRFYRIQPCPLFEANEPLLRSMLTSLRIQEQSAGDSRFARRVAAKPPGAAIDILEMELYPTLFYSGLNGLALLLFFLLALNWARLFKPDRIIVLSGIALAAGAAAVLLLVWDSSQIPAHWVTILHEGYGYQNVMQLSGIGVHAEENFLVLQTLWAGPEAEINSDVVLRATVYVNICLAVVNAVVFFTIAWLVTRKVLLALLISGLLAANINYLHASLSETPAQLLFTYFLMCVAAAAYLNQRQKTGRVAGGLSMLLLVLVGFLACAARPDMLALVLPAVMVGAVQLCSLGPRLTGWLNGLWKRCVRNWRYVLPAVLVIAAASTWWWLNYYYPGDQRIGWVIDGLFPFNPSFLTPPRFLVVYLSLGLVLLILLGFIDALRRPLRFFLVPLTMLILWRVYYSASHGYGGPFLERFRFMTFLTPVFIFFAIFSFREIKRWRDRLPWLRARARTAAVLLGATFLVWCPWGWGGYLDDGHDLPGMPHNRFLLSRNQQTEMRYLLDLMDRYPRCVFFTRTIKHDDYGKPQYLWGLFGQGERMDLFPQKEGETLDEIVDQRACESPCVLFYMGLDCNKQSGDNCEAQIMGRLVVEEQLIRDLPYTDYHGGDSHPPVIRLGVFRVQGDPPPRSSCGAFWSTWTR